MTEQERAARLDQVLRELDVLAGEMRSKARYLNGRDTLATYYLDAYAARLESTSDYLGELES